MASSSGGSELPVTMQPPAAQAAPAASAQRHYFRHTPTNYNVHDWTCGQRPFGCERPQSAHAYSFEFEGEQICGRCFAQWSDDNWSKLERCYLGNRREVLYQWAYTTWLKKRIGQLDPQVWAATEQAAGKGADTRGL